MPFNLLPFHLSQVSYSPMRLDRIYKLISLLAIEYQCDVTNDIEFFNSWDHLYGLLERGRLMKFLNLSYNCLEINKTEASQ